MGAIGTNQVRARTIYQLNSLCSHFGNRVSPARLHFLTRRHEREILEASFEQRTTTARMAGPAKSSDKKQASLTSFFTRKTANGLSQLTQSPPGSSQDAVPEPSKKRPLEETVDSGNEKPGRTPKRPKPDLNDELPSSPPISKPPAKARQPDEPSGSASSRAGRYAYDASRPSSSAAAQHSEDEDEVTKRKKEELHRKFVKKLGHPDSMARSKRLDSHVENETGANDGEEAEDPDEDEQPAASKTKKKGSKTGKLTPMEIQFLDIKRAHMDTVLIVEVGYKFKFFGEDARIASKELSIVCIPGKFRYDERELFPSRTPRTAFPETNGALQIPRKATSTASPPLASPFTACPSMRSDW